MTTKVSKNLVGDGFVLDTGDTMTGDLTIETTGHVDLKVTSTELGNLARLTLANTGNNVGCQLFAGTGQIELHRTSGTGISVGRVFAATGAVIQFDDQPTSPSVQSASVDALTRKDYVDGSTVSLTGDTMTGDLIINHGTSPTLTIKPAGGSPPGFPGIKIKDSTDIIRASIHMANSTGALSLVNYDAVGTLETNLSFSDDGNVTVNGTAPTAASHLTRKDYVDAAVPMLASYRCTAAGTLADAPAGWTITKGATGYYTINHNLGLDAAGILRQMLFIMGADIGSPVFVESSIGTASDDANFLEYKLYNYLGNFVDADHKVLFTTGGLG